MRVLILSFLIFYTFTSVPLIGQSVDLETVATPNKSPYHAVYNHLIYLQSEQYDPGLSARSLSSAITDDDKELAIQLKQIYDGRGLFIDMENISTDPAYLDSLSGHYIYKPLPGELPEIFLERVDTIWYYSQRSIKAIPRLHAKAYPFGASWLISLIPNMGSQKILGLESWQVFGFLIILGLCALIFFLLQSVFRLILKNIFTRFPQYIIETKSIIQLLAKYASFILTLSATKILFRSLLLPINLNTGITRILNIFSIVFFALLAVQLLKWALLYLRKYVERTDSRMDNQLLPILERSGIMLIFFVAALNIMNEVNVNVTALLAGISIGGLALALAAQDTVKNLIGSVMIFTDQPFQIGDYIAGSDIEGTIEEVGFRTTKIRKVDSSLQIIPNGRLSDLTVNNFGPRIHRMFQMNLGISYDSKSENIEQFLQALKKIILDHPDTNKTSYYVNLKNLADSSIDIFFRCFLMVNDYKTELDEKEKMIFQIMDAAQSCGISFAFPSMTIYRGDESN